MLHAHFIICAACVLYSSFGLVASLPRRMVRGPVITTDFADPSIIKVGDIWYAFATQSRFDYTHIRTQIATSPDFDYWTVTGLDALGTLPEWVNTDAAHVWSPDVNQLDDGSFVLYFSAPTYSEGIFHCIGVAVSESVLGPYESISDVPFACPLAQGGAIDPSGFRDTDGKRYVLYKVDANSVGHGGVCGNTVAPIVSTPIMIQEVEMDGVTPIDKPIQLIINGDDDGPYVEAPSMVKIGDGTYILFYSSDCFVTTAYNVNYATSRSPTSGFVKAKHPLFETGTNGLIAPGSADVSGSHMAFHGYQSMSEVGGRRVMYVATINVSNDIVTA